MSKWRWRDDEILMKEFHKLSKEERDEYLLLVQGLPKEQRSSTDDIYVAVYNLDKPKNKNKFWSVEE
jgi:hypothetical protein